MSPFANNHSFSFFFFFACKLLSLPFFSLFLSISSFFLYFLKPEYSFYKFKIHSNSYQYKHKPRPACRRRVCLFFLKLSLSFLRLHIFVMLSKTFKKLSKLILKNNTPYTCKQPLVMAYKGSESGRDNVGKFIH